MTDETTVRLADLCDLVSEQVDPRARPPESVYVGLGHVASGRLLHTGKGKASDVRSAKSSFQTGDVLYGKLRPYLDKAVLAQEEGVCTTELLVLRAKQGVNPRFLVSVLHSRDFVEYAVSGSTGAQHPRTSWAHIREFRVSASVIGDQDRIGELLWLVHDARSVCEKKRAVLEDLFKVLLHKLMTEEMRVENLDLPQLNEWRMGNG